MIVRSRLCSVNMCSRSCCGNVCSRIYCADTCSRRCVLRCVLGGVVYIGFGGVVLMKVDS